MTSDPDWLSSLGPSCYKAALKAPIKLLINFINVPYKADCTASCMAPFQTPHKAPCKAARKTLFEAAYTALFRAP